MTEQFITVPQLSKKLGFNSVTLRVFLCRFGEYAIKEDDKLCQYKYKYNYFFLDALEKFFKSKLKVRHGQYYKKYYPIVKKLQQLKREV